MAPALACACTAGPPPVWRISSVTRPRRSRGHRTERGPTAGWHRCGCILGRAGIRLAWVPVGPGQARGTNGPGLALGGPGTSPPGYWPAHVPQEERVRAHCRPALPDASMRIRTRAPGGPGHSSITVRVTMSMQVTAFGHRTSLFRSARRQPTSGPGPLPVNPCAQCKRPAPFKSLRQRRTSQLLCIGATDHLVAFLPL